MTTMLSVDESQRLARRARWPRLALSLAILLGFVTWATWYVTGHAQQFAAIANVSLLDLLTLYALFGVILVGNGLYAKEIVSAFGITLEKAEYTALSVVSSFTSYFLPGRGGAGLRAVYLQRFYQFPLSAFIATLAALYVMHIVVNGLLALFGMAVVAMRYGRIDVALAGFVAAVVGAGLGVLLWPRLGGLVPRPLRFRWVVQLLHGWQILWENRRVQSRLWGLTLLIAVATICQTAAAFSACAVPLSWEGICVYAGLKNLSALVSLTPGALGIVEGMSIYLGGVLEYTAAEALLVQAVIRGVAVSSLLCASPWAFFVLRSRLRRANASPAQREQANVSVLP